MGTRKSHLTWVGKSGRERGVQEELALARLVNSTWTLRPPACEGDEPVWQAVVEPLDGWLKPLWACDEQFLYLRRPEGIWKTPLPKHVRLMRLEQAQLSIRSAKTRQPMGSMLLGCLDEGKSFDWRTDDDEPASLSALDLDRSPERFLGAEQADFIGSFPHIRKDWSDASRLVIDLGEDASEPPTFDFDGEWLYSIDATNGQVLGYFLDDEAGPTIRAALEDGQLWARYHGPFIEEFTVRVAPRKAS